MIENRNSILDSLGREPDPPEPALHQLFRGGMDRLVTPATPEDNIKEFKRLYRDLSKLGTDYQAGLEQKVTKWGTAQQSASDQQADPTPRGLAVIVAGVNEVVRLPGWWAAVVEQRHDRRRIVEVVFGSPLDQRPDTVPPIGGQIMEVLAGLLTVDDLADHGPDDGWARYVLNRIRNFPPDSHRHAGQPWIFPARHAPATRLAEALIRASDKELGRLGRCANDACGGSHHNCSTGFYPYFVDTTQAQTRSMCCRYCRLRNHRHSRKTRG